MMLRAFPASTAFADPRLYQILALCSLLALGVARLGFDVPVACIGVTLGAALGTQYLFTRLMHLPSFDSRSALITSFSLCLLLRVDSLAAAGLASAVAIASKFLLRVNGKHVFNPANFAIALFALLGQGWISPAQWGSATWFAFLFACLGMTVVTRARRADVTLTFLACYAGLLFARAAWLGDPLAIPLKQLQSGALLLFAFFMICDPKTTPDAKVGRILFAAAVALCAFTWQYMLYNPRGLIYSLALLAPLTILIDSRLPANRYAWIKTTAANP